jgi:hypothetical protein
MIEGADPLQKLPQLERQGEPKPPRWLTHPVIRKHKPHKHKGITQRRRGGKQPRKDTQAPQSYSFPQLFLIPDDGQNASLCMETITVAANVTSIENEENLKSEVLALWNNYEKCEKAIAPMLYDLCQRLYSPGHKGEGFNAWLKKNKKPRSTAYRWIRKYSKREGLALPYPETSKPKKQTLCHMAQTPDDYRIFLSTVMTELEKRSQTEQAAFMNRLKEINTNWSEDAATEAMELYGQIKRILEAEKEFLNARKRLMDKELRHCSERIKEIKSGYNPLLDHFEKSADVA